MPCETQRLITKDPNKPGPSWKGILVVIGGIIIHLSLGTTYIMGNFIPYIASYMKYNGQMPNISQTYMVWVAASNEIGFGIFVFLAGTIEKRVGSRLCILLGCFLMSFSILLSSYTVKKDLVSFAITDGFLPGAAISIAYPITLKLAMKWMPSRKGTVSGLVLAGHGASSAIFTQVVTAYVNPENFKPDVTINDEKFFDKSILLERVPRCFLMLGCTYLTLQIIGAAMISPAPLDEEESRKPTQKDKIYTVEDTTSSERTTTITPLPNETGIRSLTPKQILKRSQFYILWSISILNSQSILFISGLYKAYGQTFIHDDHFLAVVGSIAAIGNTLGRPLWGVIADKFGERTCFISISVLLTFLKVLMSQSESIGRFYFLSIVFLTLLTGTGTYALISSATYKCFGPKHYSTNFGLVFTSQAVAGILSSTLASSLKAEVGWHGLFAVTTGLAIMSIVISITYSEVRVAPLTRIVDQERNIDA